MQLTELLAIYTNAESTEEAKKAALDAFEDENKPKELDTSELDGLKESIARLEAKNQELLQEKKTAKQQAEEAARKNMSADELKADYESRLQAEIERLENEHTGKYNKVLSQLENDNVHGKALELAAALSESPEALLPHIKSRIGFEVGENGFETFVRGSDGKRTAASFDELSKELKETAYLKPLLKADFSNNGTKETKQAPASGGDGQYKKGDSLSYLNSVANSVGE